MKLKIIQICAAYKPAHIYGGPTMSVAKLSEELVKAGQDVTVLATTANGKEELEVPAGEEQLVDGVNVFYFRRLTKDHTHFSPALLIFLHRTIKNTKRQTPNIKLIIHIHAWWNLVSIFSCLIAKFHGIKVILSPRGMLTSYSLTNRNAKFKDAIHFFLGKQLLRYCHIHATSTKEQKDVQQTCEVNGISVIPNFVNFPNLIPQKELPNEEEQPIYKLLFLSRVEEKKGIELLFEALTKVSIPWHLSIGGNGNPAYVESLKQLASILNIKEKMSWLGHVDNEHKFNLLANHDLMVLTSYNENFANVVIESLAMGTPVLTSKEVGLADYVTKNDLGWVSELLPLAIAEGIFTSYREIDKREKIRSGAPLIIREDFAIHNLEKQYANLYNSIV